MANLNEGATRGGGVKREPTTERPPRYTIPAGSPTHYCRGCRQRIYWVQAGSVRRLKVNADGSKHKCRGTRDAARA